MKTFVWDVMAVIVIALILIALSATGNMDALMYMPFVTVYAAYMIGRIVGYYVGKKSA